MRDHGSGSEQCIEEIEMCNEVDPMLHQSRMPRNETIHYPNHSSGSRTMLVAILMLNM
jgi:hypothetical protein